MRIALMTESYYPYINGVITHVETLKKGLEAEGHQVLIVTLSPAHKQHTLENGVLYCPAKPVLSDYGYGVANPHSRKRMELLADFRPDLIHMHTEGTLGVFALWAAKRLRIPLVYTLHTMYDDYLFYVCRNKAGQKVITAGGRLYFRRLCTRAAQIIGPSEKTAEYLHSLGVKKAVNVIPNTVDLTDFGRDCATEEAVAALRQELSLAPEDVAACFVGRLGQEKSVDVLIERFARQLGEKKGWKLFIIGDGPEREKLARQVRECGLEDKIRLLGRIEHEKLPVYYQAFDIFTTASVTEMHSISMLEAMASGLYCLVAYDPKNEHQVEKGVSGEMFADDAAFGALMDRELTMPRQERLARRGRLEGHMKQYGCREFVESILGVYEKALALQKV